MSYKKAAQILPDELIRQIQQYVDGEAIYIPRAEVLPVAKEHTAHNLHAPAAGRVSTAPSSTFRCIGGRSYV